MGKHTESTKLSRLTLEGFKSFVSEEISFGDITVLLGANGSGKSNLVSFFRMLGSLRTGTLQVYLGQEGGPDSILHGGRRATPQMQAEVRFGSEHRIVQGGRKTRVESMFGTETIHRFRLTDAAPDTLIFSEERAVYHNHAAHDFRSHLGLRRSQDVLLGAGHRESLLQTKAPEEDRQTVDALLSLLSRCRSYQFHDTSRQARIRNGHRIEDAQNLHDDAGNLAAFLYAMKATRPDCYRRIVETVRLVFPAFGEFDLKPRVRSPDQILLNWREKNRPDYLFGPHQLSDGTLRFMALATLFLQPPDKLRGVIVVDEPELGLHPYAISVLAAMIRSTAMRAQVVLATQSTRLVDEFEPNQIVVLESDDELGTRCRRLKSADLSEWLEDFSVGELWEKNHFGGRP